MDVRILLLTLIVAKFAWELLLDALSERQRKKPLPDVVKDVYDADGYAEYFEIVAEERRLGLAEKASRLAVDVALLFSPLFVLIDFLIGQNVYLAFALTSVVVGIAYVPADFAAAWWYEMRVEGKHGLSRQSAREFALDYLGDAAGRFALVLAFGLGVAFVCEHAFDWTNGFSLGVAGSLAVCAAVVGAFLALALAATVAKYYLDRRRLSFADLPEGPLRGDIERMLSGCPKKVHAISVYDESSRSNSKNALVMRLPWRREIAIADNFVNENDHRELLAVVAHEIGHLRRRKDAVDALSWLGTAAIFFVALVLC